MSFSCPQSIATLYASLIPFPLRCPYWFGRHTFLKLGREKISSCTIMWILQLHDIFWKTLVEHSFGVVGHWQLQAEKLSPFYGKDDVASKARLLFLRNIFSKSKLLAFSAAQYMPVGFVKVETLNVPVSVFSEEENVHPWPLELVVFIAFCGPSRWEQFDNIGRGMDSS